MLVLAGAGTGKTTVLIRRIARLIDEGYARPGEILALTYTNNSAQEMRDRVRRELPGIDVSDLKTATFHDYCYGLLATKGHAFDVLDEKDLWIMLRRQLHELGLKHFVRAANVGEFLSDLLNFLQRCQDELVGPAQYEDYVDKLERGELPLPRVSKSKVRDELTREETLGRCREISHVYTTVEKLLRKKNLGTFGHMITDAYDLLRSDEEFLAQERQGARFILVDEFQDANVAQIRILQLLAGEAANVFAVGDPDQGIYRFRGASSAAFALFQKHFPALSVVRLEKNRRSTTPILQCAYKLICENPDSISGGADEAWRYKRSVLVSARDEEMAERGKNPDRTPVEVIMGDKLTECADIVGEIRARQARSRARWRDFAVLYRTRTHGSEIAAELAAQGIPFTIENMDVMDTPQVRDLIACLYSVVSPEDGVSLLRVAALPQFEIKPEDIRARVRTLPRDAGKNGADKNGMKKVLSEALGGARILQLLDQAASEIARERMKVCQALETIARLFELDLSSPPARAVVKFAADWEKKPLTETGSLGEFIEYLEYFREAGGAICLPAAEEDDTVRLMTVHSAKGLEFDHIFVLRANSPSFPDSFKEPLFEFPRDLRNDASLDRFDDKELSRQEERRLFYVAMTRARDRLTVYGKPGVGKDKTPAGYLRELLADKSLSTWLRTRPPRGFQTVLFGEAEAPPPTSRAAEWIGLPPAADLSARVSASSLQAYERCPLQFKLEREWKLPREIPGAMQYGASMHRVLRAYYESVQMDRALSSAQVIAMFREDLANAGLQDRYQHELYEKQGIAQLTEFLAAAEGNGKPEVLHTEEGFEVKLAGTVVTGRIDRMDREKDGGVAITDYKTGRPQSQEDADDSLQLSIYALAAREKWGYRADRLVLHNLEGNQMVVTTRNDRQLEEVERKIVETVGKIAEGKFAPKPDYHCRFCGYYNLCPAKEKKFYSLESGAAKIADS